MNKLVILMLASLAVSSALAWPHPWGDAGDDPSELALFEDDDGETAGLKGDNKVFSDFCLSTRDDVKMYLKSGMNGAASRVFNIMFNTLGEVSADLVRVQAKTVAEGVELIKASGIEAASAQNGAPHTPAEAKAEIQENVEKVKRSGLWATVGEAVRTVINAVIETISSETSARLALLREEFTGENARLQIEEACSAIAIKLTYQLNQKLSSTKKELIASTESQSLADTIKRVQLKDVGCTTTSRINMVARFCDGLITLGPVLYPFMGL